VRVCALLLLLCVPGAHSYAHKDAVIAFICVVVWWCVFFVVGIDCAFKRKDCLFLFLLACVFDTRTTLRNRFRY